MDQPDNLMRLRLVLTILDTCGVFFSSGLAKKRLDCYLVYLQVFKIAKLISGIFINYSFLSLVLSFVQKVFANLDGGQSFPGSNRFWH